MNFIAPLVLAVVCSKSVAGANAYVLHLLEPFSANLGKLHCNRKRGAEARAGRTKSWQNNAKRERAHDELIELKVNATFILSNYGQVVRTKPELAVSK